MYSDNSNDKRFFCDPHIIVKCNYINVRTKTGTRKSTPSNIRLPNDGANLKLMKSDFLFSTVCEFVFFVHTAEEH